MLPSDDPAFVDGTVLDPVLPAAALIQASEQNHKFLLLFSFRHM